MRTTIRLDDELLHDAKRLAARTGTTLTAVIESALRASLRRQSGPERVEPIDLPSFGGGRVLPGVDLDDSAGLLDVMEADGPR
ncbi:MAG TPA: type II toxin-antitoxin system VapB family antitoxin [Acidimicrobiia bacterium]|nr:type II toxin-antitoxin system VapB family antitoxin [Acidimicrobiia bacterium]